MANRGTGSFRKILEESGRRTHEVGSLPVARISVKAAKQERSTPFDGLDGASPKLADGAADQEFGGQYSAAESHLRVMQPLEEHLHTGFADLLFVDANGGKRRVHQDGFFAIVETHQADLVRHLHATAGQRAPKPESDFVVARYDRRGPRFLSQNSPDALLTEITESERTGGGYQNRFQFFLAHRLPVAFVSPPQPRVGDVRSENNLAVTLANKVTRGMKGPLKIIEAHLIKLLLIVHAHHVVTEGDERHLNGADSLQQIWINCPGQNDSVN